jgi:hypothetical protein
MREVPVASTMVFLSVTSPVPEAYPCFGGQTLQSGLDYVKWMNGKGRDQASR